MSFKVYADFECNVQKIKSTEKSSDRRDNTSHTKKYQEHIPCNYAYNVVCVEDKLSKPIFLYRRKNTVSKFIKTILEECDYCKKKRLKKQYFHKNLVKSAEIKERFQLSRKC